MLRAMNATVRQARSQVRALQSSCNSSAHTSRIALLKPRPTLAQQLSPYAASTNARSTVPPLVDTALLSRSTVPPYVDTALFSHAEPDKLVLLHRDFTSTRAQLTDTAVDAPPHVHYGNSTPRALEPEFTEVQAADHAWRQTNHIWSNDELREVTTMTHQPVTVSDHIMKGVMNVLYRGFNFITGYDAADPSPRSVAWRLIILESFAGVPGFVAAGYRHFYSLRTLKRDHGAIYTFLEEAENERMHLMTFIKVARPSVFERLIILLTQAAFYNVYFFLYLFAPKTAHRVVGYFEEEAVRSYTDFLAEIDAGRLAVGQPADLVVIDPARSWIVDEQKLRSSSKNTPFEHARFEGYATRTIVAGETVFERN